MRITLGCGPGPLYIGLLSVLVAQGVMASNCFRPESGVFATTPTAARSDLIIRNALLPFGSPVAALVMRPRRGSEWSISIVYAGTGGSALNGIRFHLLYAEPQDGQITNQLPPGSEPRMDLPKIRRRVAERQIAPALAKRIQTVWLNAVLSARFQPDEELVADVDEFHIVVESPGGRTLGAACEQFADSDPFHLTKIAVALRRLSLAKTDSEAREAENEVTSQLSSVKL